MSALVATLFGWKLVTTLAKCADLILEGVFTISFSPPQPFVSVVIPHQGDDEPLSRCLEGLRQQTYPTDRYGVIIVVNEPEQRNLACELRDDEKIVWEPNFFSYNARNSGIEASRGEVIALTDSDTTPSPGWLENGVRAINESGADLLAGHIEVTTSTRWLTNPALYELMFAFDQSKNVSGGFSTTANLFVRREALTKLGLFEETARTGGDFDWTRAAVEAGASLVYTPTAIVDHPARESWRALLAKARRTTLPFVGAAQTNPEISDRLKTRLQFQLATAPSPEKLALLTPTQRFRARCVRVVLIAYKVLCLLRIAPQFRKDLQGSQEFQPGQIPSAQRAAA